MNRIFSFLAGAALCVSFSINAAGANDSQSDQITQSDIATLTKAAEMGNAESQHALGLCYLLGEGVLRKAITDELSRHYPRCDYRDASFQEYGFGATMVTIK